MQRGVCVYVCVQPLQFHSDPASVSAVKRVLKSKSKSAADLRSVFDPVVPCLSEAVTGILMEYCYKHPAGQQTNTSPSFVMHSANFRQHN